jgi:ribosomal protein L15E
VDSALRARWRDLPERFGPYQTAKRRYYRWIEMGVFDRLFEAVANSPDLEWLALDATIIRANAQAAGARRKRGRNKSSAKSYVKGERSGNSRQPAAAQLEGEATENLPADAARYPRCRCLSD